jgi:SAM-dependent methyltransferase
MSKVIKNHYGYYEVVNKPSKESLQKYYKDTYYQAEQGHYSRQYSKDEIAYFQTISREMFFNVSKLRGAQHRSGRMLDVGCGEGWPMKEFFQNSWRVKGMDFSRFGLEQFNPELLPFFQQGDFNLLLKDENEQFDFVVLKHVLEHVLDVDETIENLKRLLRPEGILLIIVPNDFSRLQTHLRLSGDLKKDFWVNEIEHLSYFQHESLDRVMSAHGLKNVLSSSDYPIDFDLFSPGHNYIETWDRKVGKQANLKRVRLENFMAEISLEKLSRYHQSLADLGLGRNVVNYYQLK